MKIVLISGSLRSGSYNSAIIAFIEQYLGAHNHDVVHYKGLDSLPYFTPDLDLHTLKVDNSPLAVRELRATLKDADFIIIATPEYAFEIPGALKNGLDWLVSSGEFVDKQVLPISSSTSEMGGESAYAVLVKLLGILSAKVIESPLQIGFSNKKISNNGEIEPQTQALLEKYIDLYVN